MSKVYSDINCDRSEVRRFTENRANKYYSIIIFLLIIKIIGLLG